MQKLTLKFTLKTCCFRYLDFTAEQKSRNFHKSIKNKKIKLETSSLPPKRYEEIHFVDSEKPVWNYSLFNEEDINNFQNGTHYRLHNLFGAHQEEVLGRSGYYFAVWAPN